MNNFLYKILVACGFFLLISFNAVLAQQAAKPDLAEARILCDTRTITIDELIGPGADASEADDGCLKDETETNTAWFSWESSEDEPLNFTIQPLNPNDRFSFALFTLPNLNDGNGKVAIRCALPCRTGPVGLRDGDNDFVIDDCAAATDGFMSSLNMETGLFYGLLIENTTSNGGFTISFSGDGDFVGPEGDIQPSDGTETCFGNPLTFGENIGFKNGMINQYVWTVENENGQIETSRTSPIMESQNFEFQESGSKKIVLTVRATLDAIAGQTCNATFELPIEINACCESDNKIEIIDNIISEIACPDDTNGAIELNIDSPNEANFPAMYNWSTGETTKDIRGLSDDTYSVTVSNAAGCKDSLSHTFVIPNALTAVETVIPPSCGGKADGEISIAASGGRMPYAYDFGDGRGFVASETLNGLDTGDYEVIVRDDSGCTTTIPAIELDDKNLNISFDTVAISCFGADDGQVIIPNPANGTAPFEYSINGNNPVDATALENLGPGNYTIDIFDAEGCTGNPIDFQLRNPEEFSVIIGESRKFCNGQDDGYAVAVPSGGEGTITFEWNNGSSGNTANDLLAGEYSVTVTDENGCKAVSDTLDLMDQPALTVTVDTAIDVTCSSKSDGEIVLDINGGVMPYEYSLDGINFETGTTIPDLATGDYDIVVRDNFQCVANANTTTISSPESLSFDVNTAGDVCYGETLTFTNTSTFTRGEAQTITWNFGDTTATGPGPHEITFTKTGHPTVTLDILTTLDCPASISETLANSITPCCDTRNGVNLSSDFAPPLCAGATDGSITLDITTTPPITSIDWSNAMTTKDIENLAAGEYTVMVKNDADCESSTTVLLLEPNQVETEVTPTNPTCDAADNGALSVTASGGTVAANSAFEFDFGNGFSTNNTATDLMIGSYTIMVRDDNNCITTIDTILAVPPGFTPIAASLDITEPTCEVASNGAIVVTTLGIGGTLQYDFGTGFSNDNTATDLLVGTYSVVVQDEDNCTITLDTMLAVPAGFEPIAANLDIIQPTCDVAANGSIGVTATGNGGNFQYDFGGGFSNVSNALDLTVGAYSVVIQDEDNCTLTVDTTLAVPIGFTPIDASLNLVTPSCEEATNGAIFVIATGNSAGYQYDFGAGLSNENSSMDLTTGAYSIVIQDEDNCRLTLDTMLTVNPNLIPVQATLQITQPSCDGGTDGSITVLPSGELGTDLANYEFDFGNGNTTSNVVDNLAAGQHLVVIRNTNDCSIALDTMLSELILEPTTLVTRPTCFELSDGAIQFNVPNGNGPFLYNFGDGVFQDESALSGLPEGTYNIIVQDDDRCRSEELEVLIDQPDELVLTVDPTDISCFGENDGRIVATVTGGVDNYTYTWTNGQTTNIAGTLPPGDYSLAVTDGNDCPVASEVITIIEPAELFADVSQIDNVLCFGETNGAITVNAMGGSAPFEYSLDGVIFQQAATLTDLPAGDYTVIVKDSRDCEVPIDNVTINEPDEFIVTATVNDEVAKLGFTVSLSAEANVTTTGSINYTWATPDSIVCTNCQRYETVPAGSTIFTVTAVNADNCQATDEVKVAVSLDRPVYIPNIFSPNGDGINDEFFIPFSPAMTAVKELRIFDRSGNMVFEAYDIQEGEEFTKSWDGEFNGNKIRQGVFVVTAQITFVDKQTLPYQADVTLITSE